MPSGIHARLCHAFLIIVDRVAHVAQAVCCYRLSSVVVLYVSLSVDPLVTSV